MDIGKTIREVEVEDPNAVPAPAEPATTPAPELEPAAEPVGV